MQKADILYLEVWRQGEGEGDTELTLQLVSLRIKQIQPVDQ